MVLRDSITLYTVTYPDGSGDDVSKYGDPERVEALGVSVPAAVTLLKATEILAGRDERETWVRVVVGPAVAVDGLARFEWRGTSFEVMGEPVMQMYRNGPHHYQFNAREVKGL